MNFKSFLTDFKKIASLYGFVILIEVILIFVLGLALYIVADIVLLGLLLIIGFIAVQFYIYYEFQKRLIKKVYNPEFNKNKNIVIMMGLSILVVIIFMVLMLSVLATVFINPMKLLTISKDLEKYKFLSYLSTFGLLYAYSYLLFDIKKPLKNVLINVIFMIVQFILSFILMAIYLLILTILALILSMIPFIGMIILVILAILLTIALIAVYKTIYITLVKYFKEENKIETKTVEIFNKTKDFFKNLIK